MSTRAGHADRRLIPHDLGSYHRHGLALRRVDLPGHNAAPRLVFGQAELSKPATRTRGKETNVVRDLHHRARNRIQRPVSLHHGIVRRKGFKLPKDLFSDAHPDSSFRLPCWGPS